MVQNILKRIAIITMRKDQLTCGRNAVGDL